MPGRLLDILKDMEKALHASGASASYDAVSKLHTALVSVEGGTPEAISAVSDAAEIVALPNWRAHLNRLQAAQLSEPAFAVALKQLKDDKSLRKTDILKIVEGLTGSLDKKASMDKLVSSIEGAFYERIYERDASEMAKRATPW